MKKDVKKKGEENSEEEPVLLAVENINNDAPPLSAPNTVSLPPDFAAMSRGYIPSNGMLMFAGMDHFRDILPRQGTLMASASAFGPSTLGITHVPRPEPTLGYGQEEAAPTQVEAAAAAPMAESTLSAAVEPPSKRKKTNDWFWCNDATEWRCDTCFSRNPNDTTQCMACTAPKPGNGNSISTTLAVTAPTFTFGRGTSTAPSTFGGTLATSGESSALSLHNGNGFLFGGTNGESTTGTFSFGVSNTAVDQNDKTTAPSNPTNDDNTSSNDDTANDVIHDESAPANDNQDDDDKKSAAK